MSLLAGIMDIQSILRYVEYLMTSSYKVVFIGFFDDESF